MERNHIYIKALAKVNLALDIIGKRADGYHEISTIMQSLELYDGLYIKKVFKPNYLKVISNLPWLPEDERNLAYRAAKYMKERFGIEEGIFINIDKAIPSSAGLGGGSADCAATLVGIRNLFGLPITDEELCELSVMFGADVPFCIKGGLAHATGIGEVLVPLPPLPNAYVVLAKPNIITSTEDVFSKFDMATAGRRPDIEKIIYFINKQDLEGVAKNMANVLESVTATAHPIIFQLKETMLENGALGAMMTGSGSTVFGIFAENEMAKKTFQVIKNKYTEINNVFLSTLK